MLAPLSDGVLEHARRRVGAPALVWRGEPITYGGLGEMVHRARAQLESLELPEHASVGVPARKSPQTIALVLACLMARRPVLLPSVDLGPETLGKLLGQAGCSHSLSAGEDGTVGSVATTGEATRSEDDPTSARSPRPDDVALMLTTSGSTGVPKIVPLSHGALDRFTAWAAARFDIAAGRTVLNYAPLNFDLCLLDVWTTLRYGGCVALVDPDRATRPDYLLDLLTSNDVDVVQAVPMLYGLLLDAARDGERELPGIEHVLVTGDSFPARSLAALSDLFPRSRFYNVYGCTETNDSFIHEIDLACGRPDGRIPIGSPLPGVDAVIVTAEDRVVAGPGTGELLVTTPFQTRGYLSQPLNDGRFVPHPEGTDARTYFRTGDIVRRHADGSITLEGRTESREGPWYTRQYPRGRAGPPRARPGARGGGRPGPRRAGRPPAARGRQRGGDQSAEQPVASPPLRAEPEPGRRPIDDGDRDRALAEDADRKGRSTAHHRTPPNEEDP